MLGRLKMIGLATIAVVLSCSISVWALPIAPVPQTGQTKCYDSNGLDVDCNTIGHLHDGAIRAGKAWPLPRFVDNYDGTVTDNLTSLVWAIDANLVKTRNPEFDVDYTIGDGGVNWVSALEYIKKLNNDKYLGYDDWRLPNVNELKSLVNLQQSNPALNINHSFTNVQPSRYWTSSAYVYSSWTVWVVDFSYGSVDANNMNDNIFVWPVRGESSIPKTGQTRCYGTCNGQDGELQKGLSWPSPRFIVDTVGMITDDLTGLVWTINANSPGPDSCSTSSAKTWQDSLAFIQCLNNNSYLGYSDWRLPNREELLSLTDKSQYGFALPSGHPFTNVQSTYYWSSTSFKTSGGAWIVSIFAGGAFGQDKANSYSVWPVRGGLVGDVVIDSTPPNIKLFQLSSENTSLTRSVNIQASDNDYVSSWCLSEVNSVDLCGWTSTSPTTYSFSNVPDGISTDRTVHAWAKDAAGNISSSASATATITLPDVTKPVITEFVLPRNSVSLNVAITTVSATDNVGVTGYLITTTATVPSATDPGWSPTPPGFYTFLTNGPKTLYAWVMDAAGNISNAISSSVTVNAPDGRSIPKIQAGMQSFAIHADGTLFGWGKEVLTPTPVPGARGWKDVAGSFYQYMGVNSNGGLCDLSAFPDAGICTAQDTWRQIDSGFYFNVGIKTDGSLWSWGYNTIAQVGSDSDWVIVTAGASHAVALKRDGSLWAWGLNDSGQVGDGSQENRSLPVRIGSSNDWIDIDAGEGRTLALKSDGSLWGWGGVQNLSPTRLGNENNWADISVGYGHNAAVKNDGTLWTWGRNYFGELGTGNNNWQTAPVRAGIDSDWVKAAAGFDYSLGEKADGSIWGWGENSTGKIGDGTKINRLSPVPITNLGGNLTINDGSTSTSSPAATLWLSGFRGWVKMQFSADGITWNDAEPYTPMTTWSFPPGDGVKTVYVRYLNAAGQWTEPFSASVTLDTTAPAINTFTIPATGKSLTIDIAALSATDNIAVTGYMLTEISTTPSTTAPEWSSTAPASYRFSNIPTETPIDRTLYAWAKDAAGNVSVAATATITLSINGVCGPVHNNIFTIAPDANLCASGTTSSVTGSGPWNWSCIGTNGGTAANCMAYIQTYPITLSFAGTGDGSVSGDASCMSGAACQPVEIAFNTNATLIPLANGTSTFTGWSGACTNTSGNCSLTMDSAKTVTAIFTAASRVKVGAKEFSTIQTAHNDAATVNNSVIKLLEGILTENVIFGRSIGITLDGGYNAAYDAISTETTIQGPLKIRSGTVRMKRIKVK